MAAASVVAPDAHRHRRPPARCLRDQCHDGMGQRQSRDGRAHGGRRRDLAAGWASGNVRAAVPGHRGVRRRPRRDPVDRHRYRRPRVSSRRTAAGRGRRPSRTPIQTRSMWSASATPMNSGPSAGIFALAFNGQQHGLAVGGDFATPAASPDMLARRRMGGANWSFVADAPNEYRSGAAWVTGTDGGGRPDGQRRQLRPRRSLAALRLGRLRHRDWRVLGSGEGGRASGSRTAYVGEARDGSRRARPGHSTLAARIGRHAAAAPIIPTASQHSGTRPTTIPTASPPAATELRHRTLGPGRVLRLPRRVHERGRAHEEHGGQERRQESRREPGPRLHDVDLDDRRRLVVATRHGERQDVASGRLRDELERARADAADPREVPDRPVRPL